MFHTCLWDLWDRNMIFQTASEFALPWCRHYHLKPLKGSFQVKDKSLGAKPSEAVLRRDFSSAKIGTGMTASNPLLWWSEQGYSQWCLPLPVLCPGLSCPPGTAPTAAWGFRPMAAPTQLSILLDSPSSFQATEEWPHFTGSLKNLQSKDLRRCLSQRQICLNYFEFWEER